MAIIWSAISSPESETSRRLRPAPHVSPTRAHPTSIAPVPARTSSSRPPSPGRNPPAGSPCTRARHLGGPAARRTRTAWRCAIGPFPSDPGVGKRGANGAHTPLGSPKWLNKGSAPEPSRELQAFNQPSSPCGCTSCCYSPAPPHARPRGQPCPRRTRLAAALASFARRAHLPSLRFLLGTPKAGSSGPGPAQQHIDGQPRGCGALACARLAPRSCSSRWGRLRAVPFSFPFAALSA